MIPRYRLRLIALLALALAAWCQVSRTAPVPGDPMELVAGPIQLLDTPEGRQLATQLMTRARANETLRAAQRGYDLKIAFTVNSIGQTQYDGEWQMEEIYVPKLGTRWTAKSSSGYSTTQIQVANQFYGDAPGATIPLRLHEARSSLFGAVGTVSLPQIVRMSKATYRGGEVTCILQSDAGILLTETPGRRWDEIEDCIDPQTGLLQLRSEAPGHYQSYDYSGGPQLGDRVLPRKVMVTEGGKVVSELRVESLTEIASADPSLFVPTAEMKARGQSVSMGTLEKLTVVPNKLPPNAAIQPVCVFGMVAPSGEVIELHSLQPSDSNSAAAIEYARHMYFPPSPPEARPVQHFVFVIAKFAAAQ